MAEDGLIEALLIRGFDRLRAAAVHHDETDPIGRLRASGVRYRRFALDNPQFYAVMFTDAIPHKLESPEVEEHAGAAFGELVDHVQYAITAGAIAAGEPREIAQQLWGAIHGAVLLELLGLVQSPEPEATYLGLLDTMLRGLSRD